MNVKSPLLFVLVLLGVLFALSSCSESGTKVPDSALSNYSLTYDAVTVAAGIPVNAVPKWGTAITAASDVVYSIKNSAGTTDLPTGLRFAEETGAITGAPTDVAAEATYTITASAREGGVYTGTVRATISIEVLAEGDLRGYTLSYNEGKLLTGIKDEQITALAPSWPSEVATPDATYSSTPDLPEGLSLNDAGAITGTPTDVAAEATYTITASAKNGGSNTGEQTTTISIVIKSPLGHKFTYPIATGLPNKINVSPDWETTPPTNPTVTYTVDPKLPDGLTMDDTGKISGSFADLTHGGAYRVTATGDAGIATAVFFTLVLDEYTTDTTGSTAISTGAELEDMTAGGTYHLTNHIDLGAASWDPLFTEAAPFTGTLDGNGYAIYNLNIEGGTDNNQGLFAAIGTGATVKNLGIAVSKITGGGTIGALAGSTVTGATASLENITSTSMGTPSDNSKTITGIANTIGGLVGNLATGSTLIGNSIGLSVSGGGKVAGLVGQNSGTITGYATGLVNGDNTYVGGLVGENSGPVTGYATGSVFGGAKVGGLVGYNRSTVSGYATGKVSGTGDYVGGLVGENGAGGTVTGYATSTVATSAGGGDRVGGLVGENSGTVGGYATGAVTSTGDNVGGLVGQNNGRVTGYATGSAKGDSTYVGGLVGLNNHGGIVSGYATAAVEGTSQLGGLVGLNNGTVNGYATGSVTISGTDATNSTFPAGGLVGTNQETVSGYATGKVSVKEDNTVAIATGSKFLFGGLVGENTDTATGYATGWVFNTEVDPLPFAFSAGGLVGKNTGGNTDATGYWDQESTGYGDASTERLAGGRVSATANIAYTAGPPSTYTDGGNSGAAIFDATDFTNAFALPAASATWPKLSANMTFNYTAASEEKVFTLVQPTISDTDGAGGAGDGTIEIDMPNQEKFPEGWPLNLE